MSQKRKNEEGSYVRLSLTDPFLINLNLTEKEERRANDIECVGTTEVNNKEKADCLSYLSA